MFLILSLSPSVAPIQKEKFILIFYLSFLHKTVMSACNDQHLLKSTVDNIKNFDIKGKCLF